MITRTVLSLIITLALSVHHVAGGNTHKKSNHKENNRFVFGQREYDQMMRDMDPREREHMHREFFNAQQRARTTSTSRHSENPDIAELQRQFEAFQRNIHRPHVPPYQQNTQRPHAAYQQNAQGPFETSQQNAQRPRATSQQNSQRPNTDSQQNAQRPHADSRQNSKKDYYKILNVPRTASISEIKRAYRNLAQEWHPDKYKGDIPPEIIREKMSEINEAYAILSDTGKMFGDLYVHIYLISFHMGVIDIFFLEKRRNFDNSYTQVCTYFDFDFCRMF